MHCHCCGTEISQARKVKISADKGLYPRRSLAFSYLMKYRWSFVCPPCYVPLSTRSGLATSSGCSYRIAAASIGGKATIVDQRKYERFLQKECDRWGPPLVDWVRWNSGTVFNIAQKISATARFDALPFLAHTLEEAGCKDADLLPFFRHVGNHFQACWQLEVILLAG